MKTMATQHEREQNRRAALGGSTELPTCLQWSVEKEREQETETGFCLKCWTSVTHTYACDTEIEMKLIETF